MEVEEHKQFALKERSTREKIKDVVSWIVVLFSVTAMVFFGVIAKAGGGDTFSLFGHRLFIAQTNSMAATDFSSGDLVITKAVADTSTLSEGDVITFISQDAQHYGEVVTHKIRKISVDEPGNKEFITYGTTTNTDDKTPVSEKFVIGKYKFRIPKLGSVLAFIKTTPGYISCVLVPLFVLIILNVIDYRKQYKRYKEEKDIEREVV